MFKLAAKETFWQDVFLTVPGESEPVKVQVEYKHQTKTQLAEMFKGADVAATTDEALLGGVINDWKGFDGPYNTKNLAKLLDQYPASAMELFAAFKKGAGESRAKN